ncbi:glycosyltransferase, partial [Kineococcus sp. R8]|uniref:glycosyltransferase n=1 Tax=Kineococcus siccus TaxID=2696567 RepID=UPI0014129025|nr:glycosyltransferase [Kineococcus siccus]
MNSPQRPATPATRRTSLRLNTSRPPGAPAREPFTGATAGGRRVSALVVVRDERGHLGDLLRTLHTAQSSSGVDVHLVVVDDASTDTTRDVDAEIGGDATIVRFVAPRGLVAGLRAAAQLAATEEVLVFCPRDLPDGDWLARLWSSRTTAPVLRWGPAGTTALDALPTAPEPLREGPLLTTRTAVLAALGAHDTTAAPRSSRPAVHAAVPGPPDGAT